MQGTPWQPGVLDSWPGVRSASELQSFLSEQFQDLVPRPPGLQEIPLLDMACRRLQMYWVDTQMRGRPALLQGPCWAQQRAKQETALSMGVQKGGPLSKWACAPLLPHGLSKEAHMTCGSCLPSPLDTESVLDDDCVFALRAMFVRSLARTWRRQQRRALRSLVKWPRPWDEALKQAMLPEVFCVASNRRPAVMTALAWLLRWPDLTLGRRFVEGFTLLGHIEEPAIFNKLDVPAPVEGSVGLGPALGAPAASVVDRVIKSLKPDEHAAFISDFTRGEIAQGLASGPCTRAQMDEKFGKDQWLPMQRFAHVQHTREEGTWDGQAKAGMPG